MSLLLYCQPVCICIRQYNISLNSFATNKRFPPEIQGIGEDSTTLALVKTSITLNFAPSYTSDGTVCWWRKSWKIIDALCLCAINEFWSTMHSLFFNLFCFEPVWKKKLEKKLNNLNVTLTSKMLTMHQQMEHIQTDLVIFF